MHWSPIPLSELQKLIELAVNQMSDSERALWNLIRIEPQKWSLSPLGNKGGGFWVVAVFGKQCIYYNDIEEGFNTSPFGSWETIGEYWCNQDQLQWILYRLRDTVPG